MSFSRFQEETISGSVAQTARSYRIGINKKIVGKYDSNKLSYVGAFVPKPLTLQELADHCGQKGHPWMPSTLDDGKPRRKQYANYAELLALDIDDGMTIEQAKSNPFFAAHCGLAIESASSSLEQNKFRAVLPLSKPIVGHELIETCLRYMLHLFPEADKSCKDASRYFFGATGRTPFILNESASLPESFLADALTWQAQQSEQAKANRPQALKRYDCTIAAATDVLFQTLEQQIIPRIQASPSLLFGDLEGWRDAGKNAWCPFCTEVEPAPSFNVAPHSPVWICYGCSPEGGNYLSYAQRRFGISLLQAVEYLAQLAGVDLPKRKDYDIGDDRLYQQKIAEQEKQDRCEQAEEKERQRSEQSSDQRRKRKFREETERIQAYLNGNSAQPTLSVCGEFITSDLVRLPEKSGIIIVQAPTKSRKSTVALKALIEQHRARYGEQGHISAWVPRRKLGLQLGKDLDLPLHKDDATNRFTACVESIRVCNPINWHDDIPPLLLFDEPSMTFKQILEGGTTKDNQAFVLDRLRNNLKAVADRGGWILLSEDTVTDLELDFIRTASGLEVVEFLDFHKKPEHREIQLYDRISAVWAETKRRLEDGQNIIQGSDCRRELERVEQLVLSLRIPEDKVFLFTKETAHQPYFDEFIADRAAFIEKYQPRYIGFSPLIGTGVSIEDETGHFNAMALHLNQLEPRDAIQISERLRSDAPRYGFVKESAFKDDDLYSSSRPDVIKRDLFRNRTGIEKLTNFGSYVAQKADAMGVERESYQTPIFDAIARLDAEKDDINTTFGWYLDFYCRYKARENYNKGRIREGLISRWVAKGYSVSFVETVPNKEMQNCRKQTKRGLEQVEANKFAECDTSDTTLQQAWDILTTCNQTTPEQRLRARKRILEDRLPGCPLNDAEFIKRVIVEHHGRFLKATELLWMTRNPEIAQHLDRWSWESQHTKAGQTGQFVILHKLSVRSGQAKLLNECPLQPFICGEVEFYTNDSLEAIAVKDWALLHNRQFRRYLRLTIKEEHTPVKVVNKILRKLRFEPQSVKRPGGLGGRDRVWAIANEQADLDRTLILESLTRRFNEKIEQKEQEAESWKCLSETVADMLSIIRDAIKCGTTTEILEIFTTLSDRVRHEVLTRLTTREKAILHRNRAAA